MEDLIRIESIQTPKVHFSATTGIMEIKGRAIPDEPDMFWNDVLLWFDKYVESPQTQTLFRIDLEYFNISSSKRILFLLYKLNEIADRGYSANVEWFYRESDEDMYEVGQDYAFMVKVPFTFKEYSENDLVLVK
jgi:hypothetical protein